MASTYDTSFGAEDFGVTGITVPGVTVANVANRGAIICMGFTLDPGVISSLTFGGVAGSLLVSGDDAGWFFRLFKVLAPPNGSQSLIAAWANSVTVRASGVVANGVSDVNGAAYNEALSNAVALSIASAAGDLTVSFSGDGNTGTAHATNQTARNTGQMVGIDTGPGTAGPISHSWTHTGAFASNVIGANFVQFGGGGGSNSPRAMHNYRQRRAA